MSRMLLVAGASAVALMMTTAMPGRANAQESPWCKGRAQLVNGQIVTQSVARAGGVDSQCEVLVMPNGHLAVQNGGDTKAIDGIDATHEGAGGGHTS